MDKQKSFDTRIGKCTISPDKIEFAYDLFLVDTNSKKPISKLDILYLIISVVLIYVAYTGYQKGQIILPLFLAFLSVYFIVSILLKLNRKIVFPDSIIRKDILSIKLKRPIFHKSFYVIKFINDQGEINHCPIVLPSSTEEQRKEKERAPLILKEEGLIH
jgi:hypothetical protein